MKLPTIESIYQEVTLPLSGISVKYKPFTIGQLQNLLMYNELANSNDTSKHLQHILKIVDSCSETETKLDTLEIEDLIYLFLYIRSISIESQMTGILTDDCEQCDTETQHSLKVDIENIKVTKNEIEPTLTLKITENVSIELQRPTISSINTTNTISGSYSDFTKSVVAHIKAIYNGDSLADEYSIEKLTKWCDNLELTPENMKKLNEFIYNKPVMQSTTKVRCESCKTISEKEMVDWENFMRLA